MNKSHNKQLTSLLHRQSRINRLTESGLCGVYRNSACPLSLCIDISLCSCCLAFNERNTGSEGGHILAFSPNTILSTSPEPRSPLSCPVGAVVVGCSQLSSGAIASFPFCRISEILGQAYLLLTCEPSSFRPAPGNGTFGVTVWSVVVRV